MICKKEICCLDITIFARIIGVLGLVSTFNVKCIHETKEYAILQA
jgi:hypothetical protein